MDGGEAVAVIGIGTTSRASVEDVLAIIAAATAEMADEVTKAPRPRAIASLGRPAINGVLQEAAGRRGFDLVLLTLDELRAFAHLCVTHSEQSMRHYGIPSVAEAAALAAAGKGARLLLPRIAGRNATASVAAVP